MEDRRALWDTRGLQGRHRGGPEHRCQQLNGYWYGTQQQTKFDRETESYYQDYRVFRQKQRKRKMLDGEYETRAEALRYATELNEQAIKNPHH